jgi:hypothetical protein
MEVALFQSSTLFGTLRLTSGAADSSELEDYETRLT